MSEKIVGWPVTVHLLGVLAVGGIGVGASAALAGSASVTLKDGSFHTGGAMFAYTEYELSGEPLAEGLGMDLDLLDPDQANKPDPFDFAAGIEAYEFSEEAMYAVNYESQLGPHLVNGPVNAKSGGTIEALAKRFIDLANSVGFLPDEIPQNLYPISFPLDRGNPEFAGPVDVSDVGSQDFDITTQDGTGKTITAITPAYMRDYKTLAWTPAMTGDFTPVAAGGELLKDVLWTEDFLGGMHDAVTGEEQDDVSSPQMDQDGKYKLGVADDDGLNGMFLTQISWDKLLMIRDRLLYDGKTLGAALSPDYDASSPVWIPGKVAVSLTRKNRFNALGDTTVTDAGSSLRGTWLMLWPLGEFYGLTDQRVANGNKQNAFLAVFDGNPFPAAPTANTGMDRTKYVRADDPFSLVQELSNMEFRNLVTLHYNAQAGTLVDSWKDGRMGDTVTAFDAAYSIVALGIYERALDGLPVGYASADSGEPLDTEDGRDAIRIMTAQSDFLIDAMVGKNGLVADSYTLGKGASDSRGLGTQFAVIRGLAATYAATQDAKYRDAARKIYAAVEAQMIDEANGLYNPTPGKPFIVDTWTNGAVMGGLHVLLQVLANQDNESDPALTLSNLTQRYTTWFKIVGHGIQRAEWLDDTGEHVVAGDDSGDINGNGILRPTKAGGKYGVAAVMAGAIEVDPTR